MVDPLYPVGNHALLSGKWWGLKDDVDPPAITAAEKRKAYNVEAEQALGLVGPAFVDAGKISRITNAVVRQINLMLNEGIEPMVLRSISNENPGNTTQYRDRFADPLAMEIVAQETGVRPVRYVAKARGV